MVHVLGASDLRYHPPGAFVPVSQRAMATFAEVEQIRRSFAHLDNMFYLNPQGLGGFWLGKLYPWISSWPKISTPGWRDSVTHSLHPRVHSQKSPDNTFVTRQDIVHRWRSTMASKLRKFVPVVFMSSYFSVIGITEFSKCVTAPLFVLDSQSGEDNRFLQGALNSQLWHSALSSWGRNM